MSLSRRRISNELYGAIGTSRPTYLVTYLSHVGRTGSERSGRQRMSFTLFTGLM